MKDVRNAGVALHPRGPARARARPRHDDLGERRPGTPRRRGVLEPPRRPVHQEDEGAGRQAGEAVRRPHAEHRRGRRARSPGGNQQKLILARELETDPKLLIAAQPTRGLDVGAIEFVWSADPASRRRRDAAVLLISAELDEIYALSDRIVTLYEGRITGEYAPDAAPEDIGVGMLGGAAREVTG